MKPGSIFRQVTPFVDGSASLAAETATLPLERAQKSARIYNSDANSSAISKLCQDIHIHRWNAMMVLRSSRKIQNGGGHFKTVC